jgi:hypothetical protein
MKSAFYSALLLLTSCAAPNYYQVYKSTTEQGSLSKDYMSFEDANCIIHYNLWGEGGNPGFYIYNKTKTDIILDLTHSFFVLNNVSHEYYQNRTFTQFNSSGTSHNGRSYFYSSSINTTNITGRSTSYEEKPVITIPSETMINISEFQISDSRYINCELPRFPSRKAIKTATFDRNTSPFIFRNLITYIIKNDTVRFENRFFVSEVTNLPESQAFTYIYKSPCGKKLDTPIKAFKDILPNKFYVKYTRNMQSN